jgi:hypothetical protein
MVLDIRLANRKMRRLTLICSQVRIDALRSSAITRVGRIADRGCLLDGAGARRHMLPG